MSLFSRIFRRKGQSKRLADAETVTFDDIAVVRTMRDGTEERLLWSDLREVSIVTTEEGPLPTTCSGFWSHDGRMRGAEQCGRRGSAARAAAGTPRLRQ
jgi:hypothetical protein